MNDKTPNEATPPYAESTAPVARLALRPKEAARALGIGTSKLWSLTNRNLIPHIKLDGVVLYPVRAVEDWLRRQAGEESDDNG